MRSQLVYLLYNPNPKQNQACGKPTTKKFKICALAFSTSGIIKKESVANGRNAKRRNRR